MTPDPATGPFVRDLVHDMVNPLSSLVGFLDLLLAPDAKDPLTHRQRRMLVAMDRACTHFLGMMRDISDVSRMEEGLWTPAPAPVELRAVAERVFGEYRVLAENRHIALSVETAPGTPAVSADEHMIERFFDALLRAAGRLTQEGGRITLRLSADGGAAGVLEHTGDALSPETLETAFTASLRGPRPQEGYAVLGLALARRIARLHGGALEARPRPGGGTAFHFRFPPAP